jgi:hypothetical protein
VLFPQAVEAHLPEKAVCFLGERSTSNVQRSTFNEEKCEHRTLNIEHPTSNERPRLSASSLRCSMFAFPSSLQTSTFALPAPPIEAPIPKPRPLHLLSTPIEVQCLSLTGDLDQRKPISFTYAGQVHQLVYCNGPERITGSWWEGRNKTRDYFDVEDRMGNRFWMFRVEETRKWYLHGIYDS